MSEYAVTWVIAILLALPLYIVIRRPRRFDWKREAVLGGFVLFTAGLLALTLDGTYDTPMNMLRGAWDRICTGKDINLYPFRVMVGYFAQFDVQTFLINFVGNIVMFLPWGLGLTLLWKKNQSKKRIVLFSLALTVFIETAQLFIFRFTDIDDVLLNFTGSYLGAQLGLWLQKKFPALQMLAR